MIDLEIINKTNGKINRSLFEKIAKIGLKNRREKVVVSLVFVSDREIKKLNWQYRRKNKVTNVLSFPAFGKEKFILPKSIPLYLGEVIVSLAQAKRQAKFFGSSLEKELAKLFVHGFLHLSGYEHRRKKERQRMEKLEEEILAKFAKIN